MENASKALIMAGAVLIGIIILALMVYLFNAASSMRSAYSNNVNTTRMTEFNTKFTKYAITIGNYNTNGNYVTIHDIISLANNADQFNDGLEPDSYDYITIQFRVCTDDARMSLGSYKTVTGLTSEEDISIKNGYLEAYGTKKFVIDGDENSIEYNKTSGRIKKMVFRELRATEE